MRGTTRVAAVIGDPVHHSRSPAIFNAAFEAAELDWVYTAFTVADGDAASAVDAMRVLGISGLSVTMPHKAAVIPALDHLTGEAEVLGAVNCITSGPDGLTGHNTDGAGYLASLRADGVDPGAMRCVVLGAGGAARAVIRALSDAGASSVVVANRDVARASLAAQLVPGGIGISIDEVVPLLEEAQLLVNATPLGMKTDHPMVVPTEALHTDLVVSDLIYSPRTTPLLAAARARGCRTVEGLGMLVHQAAIAFELMTGSPAPLEAMQRGAGFTAEN